MNKLDISGLFFSCRRIKNENDKKIISFMLAILLLLTATTPSFAAVPRTEGTWIGSQYALTEKKNY